MKLKHEIRNRLITIQGVSQNPILLTGNLMIQNHNDGPVICAEFVFTHLQGMSYGITPGHYPLDRIYQAIEAQNEA